MAEAFVGQGFFVAWTKVLPPLARYLTPLGRFGKAET